MISLLMSMSPMQRYKAWWLCNIPSDDGGRPDYPDCNVVHIVEQWYEKDAPETIHVFSNAAQVELWLNGKQIGQRQNMPFYGFASFPIKKYEPGTLMALGR